MITVNWYALSITYNDTIMKPIWPGHCHWQLSLSTVSSNLDIVYFKTIIEILVVKNKWGGFEMAIRFIWLFRNGHGRFETADDFKTASNRDILKCAFWVEKLENLW